MLDTSIIQSTLSYAERVYGKEIQDKAAAEQYINTIWNQFLDKEVSWLSDAAQKYEMVAHQQADQVQSENAMQYALTAATIHELVRSKEGMDTATTTATVQANAVQAEKAAINTSATPETPSTNAAAPTTREDIYAALHIPPQTPLTQAQHIATEQGQAALATRLQEIESALMPHDEENKQATTAAPVTENSESVEEVPSPTATTEVAQVPASAEENVITSTDMANQEAEVVELAPAITATENPVSEKPELPTTEHTPAVQQEHHESLHGDLASLKEQIAAIEQLADSTENALEGVETEAIDLVSEMKKEGSDEQVDSAQSVRTQVAEAEVELSKLQQRMSHIQSLIKHLENSN